MAKGEIVERVVEFVVRSIVEEPEEVVVTVVEQGPDEVVVEVRTAKGDMGRVIWSSWPRRKGHPCRRRCRR